MFQCFTLFSFFRVIDVGTEWRTFSNEKSGADPSRVGGPENPLFGDGDLSTMIGPAGPNSVDESGFARYNNRRQVTSMDCFTNWPLVSNIWGLKA